MIRFFSTVPKTISALTGVLFLFSLHDPAWAAEEFPYSDLLDGNRPEIQFALRDTPSGKHALTVYGQWLRFSGKTQETDPDKILGFLLGDTSSLSGKEVRHQLHRITLNLEDLKKAAYGSNHINDPLTILDKAAIRYLAKLLLQPLQFDPTQNSEIVVGKPRETSYFAPEVFLPSVPEKNQAVLQRFAQTVFAFKRSEDDQEGTKVIEAALEVTQTLSIRTKSFTHISRKGAFPAIEFTTDPTGHAINQLAFQLQSRMPSARIAYSPGTLRSISNGTQAAWHAESKTLFVHHEIFFDPSAISAVLAHELFHAWSTEEAPLRHCDQIYFTSLLQIFSQTRSFLIPYASFLSFEELIAFPVSIAFLNMQLSRTDLSAAQRTLLLERAENLTDSVAVQLAYSLESLRAAQRNLILNPAPTFTIKPIPLSATPENGADLRPAKLTLWFGGNPPEEAAYRVERRFFAGSLLSTIDQYLATTSNNSAELTPAAKQLQSQIFAEYAENLDQASLKLQSALDQATALLNHFSDLRTENWNKDLTDLMDSTTRPLLDTVTQDDSPECVASIKEFYSWIRLNQN